MSFRIAVYNGTLQPTGFPYSVHTTETLAEARAWAARALGHKTLRGAATWERYQGGTVYKFGPRTEHNGYDFVVIEESCQTTNDEEFVGEEAYADDI